MPRLAVVAGAFCAERWLDWPWLEVVHHELTPASTRYGTASAPLVIARVSGTEHELVLLARHGSPATILPHEINYRANLAALADANVSAIVAIHTVGGIAAQPAPGGVSLPDDVIDYTWGREHSFAGAGSIRHVDFTQPFSAALRERLSAAAARAGVDITADGVYGATQGPRFETPAEIQRMARDGCTLVGMTGMPEAALARELELPYASLCVVVNPAAGCGDFDMATIEAAAEYGLEKTQRVLAKLF
ncbi:MAG: S-methyl-5'-thioinosine phosphorylase [Pseudomonadota bacterium]